MEGYVYTKNYNSAIADQESLRVAGRDAPTGYAAVINAKVELVGETRNPVYTDSDGKFFFRDIEAKEYTVRASKDDMEALTFKVTVPTGATVVANDIAGNSSMSMTPSATGTLTVTATADCDTQTPVPVQGTVYINSKQTTYQTPLAVIMDIMPGDYTVYVKADDYQKSNELPVTITEGEQVSTEFQLVSDGGNATPYATIKGPTDGGSAAQGTLIAFTGEAGDCEEGALTGDSLVWTSSRDSRLGTGLSLNTSELSVGQHTITLEATDSGGLSGSDSITFTITPNTAPVATILLPLNNSSFKNGAVVTFAGTGADTEDGTLSGDSLVWTSNLDDEQIGTGNSFQKNNLSVGVHTITLTVTDSAGLAGSKSVKITVESEPAPNTPPIAAIILPTDGSQYDAGIAVAFAGTGLDAQDVALTGGSLVWTYENGSLGTGNSFSLSNLPAGEHIITLTATDSGGMVDTASVTITIVSDDAPPVAAILLPIGGTEFPLGTTVTFAGAGVDAEDGNLTEDSLVWTSSLDDVIGTGVTFEKSDLTPGEHVITLTVTDSADQTDTATVTITVSDEPSQNTAPVAVIILPLDNASRAAGTTINFYGGAVDAEDVTIPNNKMIWTSDKDSQIGEGPNFSASDLSVNVHTITFTATDSEGLSGSDSITLTITE